nr:MAG TPA: KilAC domain protein [Caudoviricetes sp.]
MNELIKVTYDNDRPAVSARDLHEFLGVGADYRHWFPRMCEYGFTEGQDFNSVKNDRVQMEGDRMVSRTVDDAILTIDMAKELCMLQRNEKGKQARQYFIQLEKDWNSPEKVMARALQIANKKLQVLEAKAEENRPKVLFADSVAASNTSILVGELAKLLRQNGVDIGGTRLFRWMRENGYLIRRSGSDYNMPTQRSMEMGLFTIKETAITHADGTVTVSKTVKVTPKAQIYFVNKFLGEKSCETRGANHGR